MEYTSYLISGETIKISGIPYQYLGDGLICGPVLVSTARAMRDNSDRLARINMPLEDASNEHI